MKTGLIRRKPEISLLGGLTESIGSSLLEGKNPITMSQYKSALKDLL